MGLSDEDVREILRLIDEHELDELRIDRPGFSLHVVRGGAAPPAAAAPPAPAGAPAPAPATPPTAAAPPPPDGTTIDAPLLGTFYRASAPGEEPFVAVGSTVDADTVVCLIEVMKMMNSIKAGVAGTVVEVCAENAQLGEYGAPLFRVEPAA